MIKPPLSLEQLLIVTAIVLVAFPLLALAETQDWRYCEPPLTPPAIDRPVDATDAIHVKSDSLETGKDRSLLFEGGVELKQNGKTLRAEHIKVSDSPRKIEATGEIEARTPELVLRADSARIDPEANRSEYQRVNYEFLPRHAFGEAREITQKGKVLLMKNATYSTCAPRKRDWEFRASMIRLDREHGVGFIANALLNFKGVPLIYLPAGSFPIDDRRRTGLLYPTIGATQEVGTEFSQPLYWNIAPQMDMTLTPRFMSKRGAMLQNEFRYLGKAYTGKIQADFLGDDRIRNRRRYYYRLKHRHRPDRHWEVNLDGGVVSDANYFSDFSGELAATSTTHIERTADFVYGAQHVNGLVRLQEFQTIDDNIAPEDRPYRRLPQFTLESDVPFDNQHASLNVKTDFTRFIHGSLTDANRFDFAPTLSFNWLAPGAWVKPAVGWRYTWYDLDRPASEGPNRLTRELPTATLDSGLIFERRTRKNDVQTLEPRLFLVDTPFRAQDDIPVFDSDEPAFIFSSLFRANRFSGLDRIGDTRQATLALSSRVLDDEDASEKFSASIGQIFYMKDRNVTLPGEDPHRDRRSDLAAELFYRPNTHWTLRGSLIADNNLKLARVATVRLHYQGKGQRILNLEHRFHRDDDINQSNLSAVWPINPRWRFFSRWLFSHESHDDLEILAGLEYQSCCWKMRLLNRRYVINDQGDYNSSFYIQLVLKGLASFGTGNTILEKSIPGYVLDDD